MTHKKTPETTELPPAFEKTLPDALFFGHLLMRVSRTWRSVVDGRLADLGLTDTTWVPLFHLHAADQALTLKQLAQRVGLDSSTLVRVVDLLESRGLVVRETDASDRRSKSLRLTEQGLAVVADVRGKLYQVEAQVLAGMDARTISTLREGMQQLHERLACIQTQDKASV
ncbi:MarR family winged helix-turn-helix transcriptional regulator [Comamonas jiangduensis]|uniref:MarR family winged helix-turn-helix transcriptional regulator n=1 Tax=Comamonas jiangduensis TaxID=1194168 RepID=UPI001583AA75|nr:MarR family transcriptional regulator [Comamonas jiangduensis]